MEALNSEFADISNMKDLIMLNSIKEEKCNEECIVCEAPLVYLEKDELMECVLCHKKEFSKTRCQNGHYVCNDCHTKGMDVIISMCLKEPSQNPIEIIRTMMNASFCHMHGPEHHVMVGAALLTAYKNAGGIKDALIEMMHRGKAVPGGACGFWGSMWSRNQCRYVCINYLRFYSVVYGIMGTCKQNDI